MCSVVIGMEGKDSRTSLEAGGAWIWSNAILLKKKDNHKIKEEFEENAQIDPKPFLL